MGALGFFYVMHMFAVKWCVQQLPDDMRWAIMAALLKRQYAGGVPTYTKLDKHKGPQKLGSSYLDDRDFAVEFTPDRTA
jgi:hypothetical protein